MTYRLLSDIAVEISRSWPRVSFNARPYLDAMMELDTLDDQYGADEGVGIVLYFLSNAGGWKGPRAQQIKAELRAMVEDFTGGRHEVDG